MHAAKPKNNKELQRPEAQLEVIERPQTPTGKEHRNQPYTNSGKQDHQDAT